MKIYLYIFHENSLLTNEIVCLIIQYTVYYYFLNLIALFLLCCFNVGYRHCQSHALINYHYKMSAVEFVNTMWLKYSYQAYNLYGIILFHI